MILYPKTKKTRFVVSIRLVLILFYLKKGLIRLKKGKVVLPNDFYPEKGIIRFLTRASENKESRKLSTCFILILTPNVSFKRLTGYNGKYLIIYLSSHPIYVHWQIETI